MQQVAQGLASLGRGDDSMLVHMTPGEVDGLQKLAMAAGGSLTINPHTGLAEAGFLSSMLPMLAGAAANVMLPGSGVFVGAGLGAMMNKQSPLMGAISGGIGGYGGGNLASGLMGAGEAAAPNMAMADVLGGTANVGPLAALNPADYAVSGDAFVPSASYGDALDAGQKAATNFAAKPWYSQLGSGMQAAASNPMDFAKNNLGSLAAVSAPLVSNMLSQQQPTLQNLPKQNIPYQTYAYNQGTRNTNYGQPGNKDPYSLNQGYTRTAAQGGLLDSMEQNSYPQARLPLQHMAAGGVEGYATGDVVHAPAYQGPAGEAPRFSWDIYSNAAGAGPNSDDPEEGSYSDSPGVGINTPAVGLPAIAKARAATMTLAQLQRAVEDADTAPEQAAALKRLQLVEAKLRPAKSTYTKAAHGGLMGMHEQTQEYAAGGMLLRGPGDGMSDSIPAVIKGAKPQRAALADGEFVIPADVVSHLGNGSTEAGAKRLYSMMDKVRHARTGNPKQGKQINPDKFMPA